MTSYQAYRSRQDSNNDIKTSSDYLNSYPYPPDNTFESSRVSPSKFTREYQDDDGLVSPLSSLPLKGNAKINTTGKGEVVVDMRAVSRTPSPTPSEAAELKKGFFDLKAMKNWRYWIRKEWTWYYIIGIISIIGVTLFTVYHEQIVRWLQPTANKIRDLPVGWLIPIAIFFVISFPPLFGHEILAILCGLVWGLWPGFAIVAAGTFLGELGNFYAFKYCCAARGEKMERTKISYACLARVVREGGFKIALIARFSAIPGHFTTAVFSTCGMSVWTFSLAAILSLPKQFITVYLGVALEQSETGKSNKMDTIIKDVVLAVTTIVTFAAMWYIYREMGKVKVDVIHDRRKARQIKLERVGISPYANPSVLESTTSVTFNPTQSDLNVPLQSHVGNGVESYQRWDNQGRAVGYAGDPTLYAPKPQRAPPVVGLPARFASPPTSRSSSATSADANVVSVNADSYKMRSHVSPPPPTSQAPRPSFGDNPFDDAPSGHGRTGSEEDPFGDSMHPTVRLVKSALAASQQATPTQANFAPPPLSPPPSLPAHLQIGRGHALEASGGSFYTASDGSEGHSRDTTAVEDDPYSGYRDLR